MRSNFLARLVILGTFLGTLASGVVFARARYLPCGFDGHCAPGAVLPGLKVDGEAVPALADVRDIAQSHADAILARRVRLVVESDGNRVLDEATLGELGVHVDVEGAVARALAYGQGEDPLSQGTLAERARRRDVDIPLRSTVAPGAVLARLGPLKEDEDQAPISARLDLDHHSVVGEKDGQYLDLDGAVTAIEKACLDPLVRDVAVPFSPFKPRVSSDLLAKLDISHVLASFDTGFSRGGGQANRARNIEVASSRVNGLVLMPGQAASFNEIVGARSTENGFQKAGEIFRGEMVEGVGGGTCQVASTLHAIGFFGGLDIVERLPHSRPSAYIPLGLDATVVYPSVDLKLRNPFAFPVVVHAWVEGQKLKMELLGSDKPVSVSYGRDVLATFPFTRKVVEEDWVTEPKIKQKGIKGVTIRRARVLVFTSGERRVETSVDTYPPAQEIYRVPPGFDPEGLPPVGEDPSAKKDDEKRDAEKRSDDQG
jgi:vancomycin resistance protein YoaR